MSDPLVEIEALMACGSSRPLDPGEVARLLRCVELVPGRRRHVARALAEQGTPAAADALLALPVELPGVVEGFFRAIEKGQRRPFPRRDAPCLLAVDFRRSRASSFPALLDRAAMRFGPRLERLRVGERSCYRFVVLPGEARTSDLEAEVSWLHDRLARQAGTRLWLNGWQLARAQPFPSRTLGLLIGAWFDAARRLS